MVAVRKTVSGMVKLLYPDGKFTKEDVAQILTFAMEMRRRVKEQLKKIGGMEFYDVNFSYIDKETYDEHFVPVPEQGSTGLIPENEGKPGPVYTVAYDADERLSLIKLESQMTTGNGKTSWTGIQSNRLAKAVLIPSSATSELGTVPGDLIAAFSLKFYNTIEDAVMKALGVQQ